MRTNKGRKPKIRNEMQVHILCPGNEILEDSWVITDCRKGIPKGVDEISSILGVSSTFSDACGVAGRYAKNNGYNRLNMTFDAS